MSIVTPLVSQRIFDEWFALPEFVLLPVRFDQGNEYGVRVPFACAIGLYILAFYGLAYSLFPYLVVDRLDVWPAARAPESPPIIFWGAVIVLYSVFAYRICGGKARALDHG